MCSHVLGEDRPETSYTRVMGHMDVVSIISDYFNIYFPILLILLTLATYFSLGIFNIKIIMFFWAQEKDPPSFPDVEMVYVLCCVLYAVQYTVRTFK